MRVCLCRCIVVAIFFVDSPIVLLCRSVHVASRFDPLRPRFLSTLYQVKRALPIERKEKKRRSVKVNTLLRKPLQRWAVVRIAMDLFDSWFQATHLWIDKTISSSVRIVSIEFDFAARPFECMALAVQNNAKSADSIVRSVHRMLSTKLHSGTGAFVVGRYVIILWLRSFVMRPFHRHHHPLTFDCNAFLRADNSQDVIASWVRCPQASHCVLEYGLNPYFLDHSVLAANHHFRTGYRLIYTHFATMRSLQPGTDYCTFTFRSLCRTQFFWINWHTLCHGHFLSLLLSKSSLSNHLRRKFDANISLSYVESQSERSADVTHHRRSRLFGRSLVRFASSWRRTRFGQHSNSCRSVFHCVSLCLSIFRLSHFEINYFN